MKTLDFIFYRFYRMQLSVNNYTTPVFSAILGIVTGISFNLTCLSYILFDCITGTIPQRVFSPLFFIISFVTPLVILSFTFLYKKRYKQIIERYEDEADSAVIKGNICIIAYFVFIILFMGLTFYIIAQNH
ncbi:hypothetical protein [Flavobacterium microcysteis]